MADGDFNAVCRWWMFQQLALKFQLFFGIFIHWYSVLLILLFIYICYYVSHRNSLTSHCFIHMSSKHSFYSHSRNLSSVQAMHLLNNTLWAFPCFPLIFYRMSPVRSVDQGWMKHTKFCIFALMFQWNTLKPSEYCLSWQSIQLTNFLQKIIYFSASPVFI